MLSLVASTALVFCPAQEPAAAQDEAVAQLAAATAQFAQAENYTFTSTSKTERPGGGGGFGGGGRRGGGEPVATTGTFKQGLPMLLVAGETTAYKQKDLLVHKDDAGTWAELDPQSMWGGGGRGRGRAGEAGSDRGDGAGGERRGGGMDRSLFALMRVSAPHEMLAGFEKKQETLEHAREGELDVFTGKLTAAAAEGMGGGFGRGPGGGEMSVEGTYRIEVQAGKVVGASFTIQRSGDFGGRSFEMTTETALVFSKVGETELEIPDEVQLLFSA